MSSLYRCTRLFVPHTAVLACLIAIATWALPVRGQVPVSSYASTKDQFNIAAGDSFVVVAWRDNRTSPADPSNVWIAALDYFMNPVWSSQRGGMPVTTATGQQVEPIVAVGPDKLSWVTWNDVGTCGYGYLVTVRSRPY